MNRWTVTLWFAILAVPLAAQEQKKMETRVIINGEDVKAVLVDEEGRAKVLPFGEGSGFAWVHGGKGDNALRYLDLGGHRRFIGVQLMSLTPELREHFGVPSEAGVMVSKVFEDTPAERAGIEIATSSPPPRAARSTAPAI